MHFAEFWGTRRNIEKFKEAVDHLRQGEINVLSQFKEVKT